MMDYDAQRSSLYTPALRPTVFTLPVAHVEAWMCAEISRLVYTPFEQHAEELRRLASELDNAGFKLLQAFDHDGTQAISLEHVDTNQLIIAFRGTEPDFGDIETDTRVWRKPWPQGGQVHAGFCNAFESIWPHITAEHNAMALDLAIYTGHSLGGALAHLATSRVGSALAQLVTIGSPAVGDADFATTLAQDTQLRYVNCCDLVPRLPPAWAGYTHASPALYIDRHGQLHLPEHALPAEAQNADHSAARTDYTQRMAWHAGTLLLRDMADHSPINYVRALVPQ